MDNNANQFSFRDYPTLPVIFGLASIGAGVYFYLRNPATWTMPAVTLGVGLLMFLLASVLDVHADRITRTLSISRRGLVQRYQREIPFDEIAAIQIGASYSADDDGSTSTTYRVEIVLKDGSIVPLRKSYSSGRSSKEKRAQRLREFIGVGGADMSHDGIFQAASQMAQSQLQAEQESITGNQNEIHETNGIRWQIETLAFGSSPISRWYSSDYELPDNFLYLTQKMEGQKNPPNNKLMQAMHKKLFEQSLKVYGFDEFDAPNRKNADLFFLDDRLDAHFLAYTSDERLAQQILNPWTAMPLAAWAQKYPFTKNSVGQLAVLFGPSGLYLAVMGYINTEYLEELANLGAELVRAQSG